VSGTRDEEGLPLVTVVTPSLNQGRYIEEAIRSVGEQNYPRIEHIVIDGDSTDDTLAVLARYPHVRWISEPDGGQTEAVNKGFRMAGGEVYGWLNADDYYLPGAVAAAVAVLRETGCGFVHGGWRQVSEDGSTIRDVAAEPFDYTRQLNVANLVCQPGSFFTSEAFWAVGGLDESYQYAMDYELWLRLGARFEVRHVDRIQAAYRYHSDSKSVSAYPRFLPETRRASRAHGGRFFSPMYLNWYLPRYRPHVYRVLIAMRLLRARDFGTLGQRSLGTLKRTGSKSSVE